MKKEFCIANIDDVMIANKYSDRIELNMGLEIGGITPSYSLVKRVVKKSKVPVIVMVRPRAGNFCYTQEELAVIFADTLEFLKLGVDGIAFGFLDENNNLDEKNTKKMIYLIKRYNKEAVFHRAIDEVNNYEETIKKLIELGIDRILTSGHYENVDMGYNNLCQIKQKFKNLDILVGSGINEENINKFSDFDIHGSFSTKSEKESYLFGKYIQLDENKVLKIIK